jgi:kynurenine formamidase
VPDRGISFYQKNKAMRYKLIDLTRLLNNEGSVYPGTFPPVFEIMNTVEKDGFTELKMSTVLHVGTHIDAPTHMIAGARSIDQFPIDKFFGKAMVIPCHHKKEIDLSFIQTYEDRIAQIDFILFFTGWEDKWNTKGYFQDCPTLTREAAKWLTQFKLKGIGIDSFSLDSVISAGKVTADTFPKHHILLEKEILLIENLTNLNKLPDYDCWFQCLPLNIANADGSPVRAIAMIEE